jgi:hypothetical protein
MVNANTLGYTKKVNPLMYPENEIEHQIDAIPPDEGAISHPSIFDAIMKAYMDTKTNDFLSGGQGGSPLTKSAASPLGRGGATWDEQYSTPESAEPEASPKKDNLNKLNKYMRPSGQDNGR